MSATYPTLRPAESRNRAIMRNGGEFAEAKSWLQAIEETFPAMLAYFDAAEICRHHNRAYREWLGQSAARINGKTLREILGETVYATISSEVEKVLGGQGTRYERTHRSPSGVIYQLFAYLLPDYGADGEMAGFYAFIVDETSRSHVVKSPDVVEGLFPAGELPRESGNGGADWSHIDAITEGVYHKQEVVTEEVGQWEGAVGRLRSAIAHDEFRLFAQIIEDLMTDGAPFCEIFIRLAVEEDYNLPPGEFLPIAESLGLMPEIDRWVVSHVLAWVSSRKIADNMQIISAFGINVSRDTICDREFPKYVKSQLERYNVDGAMLRFEIQDVDAKAEPAASSYFVRRLAAIGCQSILCGFGRDSASIPMLKNLPVAFVKIDSSIVLQIARDANAYAKAGAINRIAHSIGVRTIAEFVESDAMVEKLKALGVDYVQGLGIAAPVPLSAIDALDVLDSGVQVDPWLSRGVPASFEQPLEPWQAT